MRYDVHPLWDTGSPICIGDRGIFSGVDDGGELWEWDDVIVWGVSYEGSTIGVGYKRDEFEILIAPDGDDPFPIIFFSCRDRSELSDSAVLIHGRPHIDNALAGAS